MPDYIEQLRRRLLELGCPIKRVRQLVREVADHREDLKQAALAEGSPEADAEARADVQLGEPLALAENLMSAVRRSSWWGRHCIVSFGLLPLLVSPILWLLFLLFESALEFVLGYGCHAHKVRLVADDPVAFPYLLMGFKFMDYAAIAMTTLEFCWPARRAAVKLKWMAICCVICSVAAVFTWARLEPHSFFVGFSANSHLDMPWSRGAIPLLVASAMYLFQRRAQRRFQRKVAV